MDFCQTCHKPSRLTSNSGDSHYAISNSVDNRIYFSQLEISASKGCSTCFLLWKGIQQVPEATNYLSHSTCFIIEEADNYWQQRLNQQQFLWSPKLKLGVFDYREALDDPIDILEIHTSPDAPYSNFCSPATSVEQNLDIEKVVQTINTWMSTCKTTHDLCHQGGSKLLPQRVLDVEHVDLSQIFLVETHGEREEYVALSHCWGKLPIPMTTTANINDRKTGIPISELSHTFQQAVQITRALGIRYIWIDSLCILQDSQRDWENTASKMADIYANSTINLAATAAANGEGGIFNQRWTPGLNKRVRHSVRSYEIPGSETLGSMHYVRHCLRTAHDDLSFNAKPFKRSTRGTAPLLSRGWVYQERLLSPRTVHFHDSEMSWDCKSQYTCECGSLEIDTLMPRQLYGVYQWFSKRTFCKAAETSTYNIFAAWNKVVIQYSSLSLTKKDDKLPALSGIASHFQRIISQHPSATQLPRQYLAGLWRQNLERDLLWFVEAPEGTILPRRACPYRAPSWSWASLELKEECDVLTTQNSANGLGAIQYDFEEESEFKVDLYFEILDAFCTVSGRNEFGAVSAGFLKARGIVLKLGLWGRAAFKSKRNYLDYGAYDWRRTADFRIDIEIDDETYDRYTSEMVPVYVLILGSTNHGAYVGLILIKTGKVNDQMYQYLRVGFARWLRITASQTTEMELKTIEIV